MRWATPLLTVVSGCDTKAEPGRIAQGPVPFPGGRDCGARSVRCARSQSSITVASSAEPWCPLSTAQLRQPLRRRLRRAPSAGAALYRANLLGTVSKAAIALLGRFRLRRQGSNQCDPATPHPRSEQRSGVAPHLLFASHMKDGGGSATRMLDEALLDASGHWPPQSGIRVRDCRSSSQCRRARLLQHS